MFGHLKADDFIALIEDNAGDVLEGSSSRQRSHLLSCVRCRETLTSARAVRVAMAKSAIDEVDIPEPDWFQFRADVRNAMLSRAAQRQAEANRWQGWLLRPAMTWALAVAFAAGLGAGLLIWNRTAALPANPPANVKAVAGAHIEIASLDTSSSIADDEADAFGFDSELSARPQIRVFEELSQLDDVQSEKLRQLLEAESTKATAR